MSKKITKKSPAVETVKGYKAFDSNMQCRGMQYELGKTQVHEGKVNLCNSGLHFCENPLDIFGYYPPTSRFAEVEGEDVSELVDCGDSKRVAKRLHIGVEISLFHLIGAGVKFVLDRVDWANAKESNTGDQSAATNTGYRSAATNTGYRSAATNTGDQSAATNTGDQSAATNTGDQSAATNTGEEGHAASLGIEGKASGEIGCWLTLAEWKLTDKWHRIDVQTIRVDGVKIKANTFYSLIGGKFTEAA